MSSRSGDVDRAAGSTGTAPSPRANARREASGSDTITSAPASTAIAATREADEPRAGHEHERAVEVHPGGCRVERRDRGRRRARRGREHAGSARPRSRARSSVPTRSCTCVANPPDSSHPRCTRSWPYFASDRHCCGTPRVQRSHSPQLTVTDQTTRSPSSSGTPSARRAPSPTATTRPTCSWPSTSGVCAARSPRTVRTSEGQMVASSTSTRASPGESRTPGRGEGVVRAARLVPHHGDGRGLHDDVEVTDPLDGVHGARPYRRRRPTRARMPRAFRPEGRTWPA